MQAVLNRTLWFTAVTLFVGPIGTMVSHAKEPEPGELLKSQGLKRSSATWILVSEAVILKDARRAQGARHAAEYRPAATARTRNGHPESQGID